MNNLQNGTIQKLISAVLAVLFLFLLFVMLNSAKIFFYGPVSDNVQPTITVSASGEAKAVPNIATFSFASVQTGKDVSDAQNKMSDIANKAIDYLKSQGVDEKDIQTSGLSANPKYDYSSGRQVFQGYESRESITVKVRDASKAGDILAGVAGTGVTEISSLNLESDDPETIRQEATVEAIKNAREKADALADAMGVKIVRVLGFNETGSNTPGPVPYFDKAVSQSSANVSPEIAVGENTTTASVSVTYEVR